MKKILMSFAGCLTFAYASAQIEPKTSQGTSNDTIQLPTTNRPADKTTIANKSILRQNTLDAGMGKTDPIKTDIYTNSPVPIVPPSSATPVQIGPRVTTDTTAMKRNR